MSNHPSRSGPCYALWAAPTLLLTFILAACSGQPPTVADHLQPATSWSFNVCADRTGSGGEKGSQAVVPALADAIARRTSVRPRRRNACAARRRARSRSTSRKAR